MTDFFKYDNAFFRLMTKVVQIFCLNLLWILFSLPLVTVGAATTALHTVTLKMVRNEEGYILRSFWKAFRINFRQATSIWMAIVLVGIVLAGDIYYFSRWANWAGVILAGIFCICLVILGLTCMMVFHLQARFQNNMKGTITLAVRMAFRHLSSSGALLILFCCMAYGFYVSVPLMIIIILIGVSLLSYVSSYLLRRIFDIYETQKEPGKVLQPVEKPESNSTARID